MNIKHISGVYYDNFVIQAKSIKLMNKADIAVSPCYFWKIPTLLTHKIIADSVIDYKKLEENDSLLDYYNKFYYPTKTIDIKKNKFEIKLHYNLNDINLNYDECIKNFELTDNNYEQLATAKFILDDIINITKIDQSRFKYYF